MHDQVTEQTLKSSCKNVACGDVHLRSGQLLCGLCSCGSAALALLGQRAGMALLHTNIVCYYNKYKESMKGSKARKRSKRLCV